MSKVEVQPEVAEYLRRLRVALDGLPDEEIAEIVEDVEPHLVEVFEESGDLTARLGTPEDYAAELRAAAGYPEATVDPAPAADTRKWRARLVLFVVACAVLVAWITGMVGVNSSGSAKFIPLFLTAIVVAATALLVFNGVVRRQDIESLREYRAARRMGEAAIGAIPAHILDYLRGLQPAWWLIRIVLLAIGFVAAIFTRGNIGSVLFLAVIGLLLWCGPSVRTDRRLLLVLVPANAFVIGVAFGLTGNALNTFDSSPYYPVNYSSSGLIYEGSRLSNVYAVDAQGKPIPVFYLYDEDGKPLNMYRNSCVGQVNESFRNRFPQPRITYDDGVCTEETGIPFVPLPEPTSSSTVPSGSQTPSTSVSPSVGASPSVTPTR
ncbi:MAG: hypothetical protein M3548_04440 [Actinomycetota bacterium]|nr:hypothetical protein [Actinomycetota bacterium]